MRTDKLVQILTHPIAQLISFSILIFPGQLFDLPYLLILRWTIMDLEIFTIAGLVGWLLTLFCLLLYRKILQLSALIMMWLSLITFIWQLIPAAKLAILENPISLITCCQFLMISLLIAYKKLYGRAA